MIISGLVRDAVSKAMIQQAKVSVLWEGHNLVSVLTDRAGRFEASLGAQHRGETLVCRVTHAGFHLLDVNVTIGPDDVDLGVIGLDPDQIQVQFRIQDSSGSPLEGVTVICALAGRELGRGRSDGEGLGALTLNASVAGQSVPYTATLAGFQYATGDLHPSHGLLHTIQMHKLPVTSQLKDEPKAPSVSSKTSGFSTEAKIALIGVVVTAIIGVSAYLKEPTIPKTPPVKLLPQRKPTINSFHAIRSPITAGESTTLKWSVSNAQSATISPGIGKVAINDKRQVSPTKTTTYTLTARNKAGEGSLTAKVEVKYTMPKITYFRATQDAITAGARTMLEWSVSDATSVVIDPEIGQVKPIDRRQIAPTTTTEYILTASNSYGSINRPTTVKVNARQPTLADSLGCNTGKMPGDTILHFRVVEIAGNEIKFDLDYNYNTAHGSQVVFGAYVISPNGDNLSGDRFSGRYSPNPGRGTVKEMTASVDTNLGREGSELFVWMRERFKSEAFVCRRFPYKSNW